MTVHFEWQDIGAISLDAGKLRFPNIADVAGIYRFDLIDKVYIGETDRLRRRFQHYRTPGTTQPTNIRLNSLMSSILSDGISIEISVVTSAEIELDGDFWLLDLRQKSARLLVENAALTAAHIRGIAVANL